MSIQIYKSLTIFMLAVSMYACKEKDEPENVEAEIVSFNIDKSMQRSSDIGNGYVNVFVRRTAGDYMEATPTIEVSKGATIVPASGAGVRFERSTLDTCEYQAHYTITSENKQSVKRYTVTLIPPIRNYQFGFDRWDTITVTSTGARYSLPSDTKWATGNIGAANFVSSTDPSAFPTSATPIAKKGLAARLRTIKGAPMFGAPIAAGNLFWGIFNMSNPLGDKLTFTRFGQPFDQKPKKISGYYHYTAGPKFTDKNDKEVVGRVDSCFIYAIFYETDEEGTTLDGHNIQTSDRIVAKALGQQYCTPTPGSDYQPFNIDFVYDPAREADIDFVNKLYKLAIVFTSSKGGGTFEGAAGSTLLVDEVALECYDSN